MKTGKAPGIDGPLKLPIASETFATAPVWIRWIDGGLIIGVGYEKAPFGQANPLNTLAGLAYT